MVALSFPRQAGSARLFFRWNNGGIHFPQPQTTICLHARWATGGFTSPVAGIVESQNVEKQASFDIEGHQEVGHLLLALAGVVFRVLPLGLDGIVVLFLVQLQRPAWIIASTWSR